MHILYSYLHKIKSFDLANRVASYCLVTPAKSSTAAIAVIPVHSIASVSYSSLVGSQIRNSLPKMDSNQEEPLETLRSRLFYQSLKRGILENNILIGGFAKAMLKDFKREQLLAYDNIINHVDNEWDLYYYISGSSTKKPPDELKDCDVFRLIVDYVKRNRFN